MIEQAKELNYPLPRAFEGFAFEELLVCLVNFLYPKAMTKVLLVDLLSRIPLKGMEDFPWTVARVDHIFTKMRKNPAIDEMLKPHVVEGHALVCHLLQFEQCRFLIKSLAPFLKTCKQNIPSYAISLVQSRASFYLNDEKVLILYGDFSFLGDVTQFYAFNPPDPFFKKLNARIQKHIVVEHFIRAMEMSLTKNDYSVLNAYADYSAQTKGFTSLYAYFLLYIKADFKAFDEIVSQINEEDNTELFFREMRAFLTAYSVEDCTNIASNFKDALKDYRKTNNNNRLSFPFPLEYFYAFMLLKASNDLMKKPLLKKDFLAYVSKNEQLTSDQELLLKNCMDFDIPERTFVFLAQKNIENQALSPYKALLNFACLYTLPRDKERDKFFIEALKIYFEKTKHYLPLVATAFAQFLSKLLPHAEGKSYEEYAQNHHIFDFSSIFEDETSWEKRIEAVHAFMTNKESTTKKKVSKSPKRLVWFVDMRFHEVYPYEQSFSKDAWTKGRKVSASKLKEDMNSYTYLSDQDKEVIQKSVRREYWSDTFYVNFQRALPLLVGHELVFDNANNEPLFFELHEPQLEVEVLKSNKNTSEQEEEYRLRLELPVMHEGLHCEEKKGQSNTYTLVPIHAAHLKLRELLGAEELVIPHKAHTMIFDMLSQEKSPIKVHTTFEFDEMACENVNAKPTLRIKRVHIKDEIGLDVRALVYPLEGHISAYTPAKGIENFVAKINAMPVKVKRSLEEEQKNIDDLLFLIPLLKNNLLNDEYTWNFNNTQDSYSLLLELHEKSIPLEWYDSEPIKISKAVHTQDMKLKVKSKNNWFSVEGTVAIDEHLVMDMHNLLKEVRKARGRFIPLKDGQILALTEDFRKALDKMNAITQDTKNELLIHSLAAPVLQNIFDEELIESDTKWLEWKDKLHLLDEKISLPNGLQAELRPYQEEGFSWLASLVKLGAGACLADDMGLGKTLQTIALFLSLVQNSEQVDDYNENGEAKPMLIVAPTSVCHNWEVEIKRFAPQLIVHRLTAMNSKKERKQVINNLEENDILILGYALLNTELETLLKRQYKLAVFDEAQALKNPQTMRTKAALKLQSDVKIALTGTPIENSLDDLWSIFNVINTGLLGNQENFIQRFNPSSLAPEAIKNNARNNLKSLVKPFILRRTKTAVLDELPPRIEQTLIIEPSEKELALYEAMRRQAIENISKAKENKEGQAHFHVLAELTKLRRACCNPLLIDPHTDIESSKLSTLVKLVQDLRANNHQVLIFSQFTGHLEIVYESIRKLNISTLYLDGATPEKKRAELVKNFQSGKADVFCISLKAGGQGLNLTAADYVIHLDPWWNPAVEDQASDRAHRMGQLRPVTIYRLIMQGSVEEKILKLHATKRDLADDILLNTDTAHKLSLDDLLQLLD